MLVSRATLLPFALGAAASFIFSSVFVFAPSYDPRVSLVSSFMDKQAYSANVVSPTHTALDSFREAWSILGSPAPAPSSPPFASSPSQVCVMTSDTRPLAPVSPSTDPTKLDFRTFATYYNLWWSLRHGYTFHMVQPEAAPKGYHAIWTKTTAIRDMVKSGKCELVVFFDSDAYVTEPSYSLYDLLHRWEFHERAAMLLAMDQPVHSMPQNQNATNTGFMVFRAGAKALKILNDIIACPETIPECAKWKMVEKYEQTAFNHFVRPKLVEGEELIIVPCDEANGNFKNRYCHGKFITHAWHALDTVNERAGAIMVKETFAWLSRVFDGKNIALSNAGSKGKRSLFQRHAAQRQRQQ